jgi:hypothetical protein
VQLKIKFIIIFTLSVIYSNAQDSSYLQKHPPVQRERLLDKIFTGGNLGLQFGTITFIEVAPIMGYQFTEKLVGGVGVIYQYYHYKDRNYDFQTNVYGGRIFGRYLFTENVFGHAEYEYLNLEAYDFSPGRRVDVGSVLAGVGYIQRFGSRHNSGIVAMVLYNFTESVYTPYANPIIRLGVEIGL